jgi:hypothetical protein
MITDYNSYIDYFRSLATSHTEINDFVYGGSERILNRERIDLDYPVLWLELPDIVPFSGESDLRLRFVTGLMVLQATPQDFEQEDDAMNKTYQIALGILQKLMTDAEAGLFDFDVRSAVLQPRPPFSGDNDHGWHIEFDLSISASDCLTETDWE